MVKFYNTLTTSLHIIYVVIKYGGLSASCQGAHLSHIGTHTKMSLIDRVRVALHDLLEDLRRTSSKHRTNILF